jgi:hypothetical protein
LILEILEFKRNVIEKTIIIENMKKIKKVLIRRPKILNKKRKLIMMVGNYIWMKRKKIKWIKV